MGGDIVTVTNPNAADRDGLRERALADAGIDAEIRHGGGVVTITIAEDQLDTLMRAPSGVSLASGDYSHAAMARQYDRGVKEGRRRERAAAKNTAKAPAKKKGRRAS
jgi:hypothetical protein